MRCVDTRVLAQCMTRFREGTPDHVYDLFTSTLKEYADELTVAVTLCPQSEMLEHRGRAQQARKFIEILTRPTTTP